MRVLMLVATSVVTDARVLREAGTLGEAGHAVHVIGKQVPEGAPTPPGVTLSSADPGSGLRPGTGSLSRRALPLPVRAARWLLLPEHRNRSFRTWAAQAARAAEALQYDVVHAHDFTALPVGAALAGQRRVPLVYDAHELWAERQRTGRPTPLQRARERRLEGRLGARAAAVITVGSALADRLRESYGWDHVTVVRNTFEEASAPRVGVRRPPTPTAVVYAGRLAAHRELETVSVASSRLPLPVRLVGPPDQTWLGQFDPGRAEVLPPVPAQQVSDLLAEAGLALVTLSDRWGNHRIALPNKLFHAVRAGVPVVASDVGELARVVREHGIGVLYRPGDPASLAAAVGEAVDRYDVLTAAVDRAASALSWEVDRKALVDVYERLPR